MLFWQLPLLSVILANPHQAKVVTRIRQKRAVFDVLPTLTRPDRKCRSKSEQKTNKAAGLSEDRLESKSEGRICWKDKVGRSSRRVLKRIQTTFMERRSGGKEVGRSRKEMKNILRRLVFKQAALKKKSQRQEKHDLKEVQPEISVNMKQIPKKTTKKKVSLVKDLILGGLNVLELFLRIG